MIAGAYPVALSVHLIWTSTFSLPLLRIENSACSSRSNIRNHLLCSLFSPGTVNFFSLSTLMKGFFSSSFAPLLPPSALSPFSGKRAVGLPPLSPNELKSLSDVFDRVVLRHCPGDPFPPGNINTSFVSVRVLSSMPLDMFSIPSHPFLYVLSTTPSPPLPPAFLWFFVRPAVSFLLSFLRQM